MCQGFRYLTLCGWVGVHNSLKERRVFILKDQGDQEESTHVQKMSEKVVYTPCKEMSTE